MTIKEVETLTGITKANIRFYEKEGLLAPGRSSNNYREYSEDDVEHLRKIRIFRIMGFSVAQIRQLADQPQRAAVLMEARAGQIQKEVKELERVRQVCLEVRDSGWRFDTLDPQLLEMARVFRVPFGRRLRGIYLPQVMPYFRTAVSLGLGLCWKAGAAAEIIGLPAGSMGERLYTAKVYFQTADLFAWTVTIVAVSVAFERLFLALVDRLMGKAGL